LNNRKPTTNWGELRCSGRVSRKDIDEINTRYYPTLFLDSR